MNIYTSKIAIALHSPTFWSIVALFVYNGLAAIMPQLSGNLQVGANLVLMALAAYTHTTGVQQAAGIRK